MDRTTIMLPATLKAKVVSSARNEGVSLGEFIRSSIEIRLKMTKQTSLKKRDPFYAQSSVFSGDCPTDLAQNHDDYLY